jgi:hypothetical protein
MERWRREDRKWWMECDFFHRRYRDFKDYFYQAAGKDEPVETGVRAMDDERIMTLHPDPEKKGVNINRGKYEQVKRAVLEALERSGSMTFTQLLQAVEKELEGRFEGNIGWYMETVKLDLEARGLVRREGKSPQVLKLVRDAGADG